ncbi:MAG: hypothetical protein HC838_11035 [Spirulinaceae cyanobacterium RM2_2_10]|nr:hypothetical protein [Spirulinaceae cyanobacterium RM2_2_10]
MAFDVGRFFRACNRARRWTTNAIANTTPLDSDRVIALLEEVLEVLKAIHKRRIVHHNLRLSNVVRGEDDRIYFIGFSKAKPEKSNFSKDMRSLGGIAVYALTGVSPKTLLRKKGSIVWRDRVSVPQKLADVVDTMLLSNGSQGYRHATQALKVVRSLKKSKNDNRVSLRTVGIVIGTILTILGAIGSILGGIGALPVIIEYFTLSDKVNRAFVTYTNSDHEFTLQYPGHWKQESAGDPITKTVAVFVPRDDRGQNQISLEISVYELSVEQFQGEDAFEVYITEVVDKINDFDDVTIISSTQTAFKQWSTHEFVYEHAEDGEILKRMGRWVWVRRISEPDLVYAMTYTAKEEQYEQFKETATTIMNSLDIR